MGTTLSNKDTKRLVAQLLKHGYRSYQECLFSDRWRAFREFARIYYKDSYHTCYVCGCEIKNPILHHISYKRIFDVLNVRFVCRNCHTEVHVLVKNGAVTVGGATHSLVSIFKGQKRKKLPKIKTDPLKAVTASIVGFNGGVRGQNLIGDDFLKAYIERSKQIRYEDEYAIVINTLETNKKYFNQLVNGLKKKA